MFDLGWQEFILIAFVAVVVVGPKDLPRVIRTVGQWIRKARSLASEFQGSLEEMAREAELDDVRKQIQQVSREGVGASIEKHIDPSGEVRKSFEEARESAGADEIESALDQARRDVGSMARGAGDAAADASAPEEPASAIEDYASLAARSRIPDNSVTPPTPTVATPSPAPAASSAAAATTTTSSKSSAAKSSTKPDGAVEAPAPKPARRASTKASDASPAKPPAKPRRQGKTQSGPGAGEA